MFSGIIETVGTILDIKTEGTNKNFIISTQILNELTVDQSISHNGVCLTVTNLHKNCYEVTAVDETLQVTNLNELKINDQINLERCLPSNGRFDGHVVQGHVDTVGKCTKVQDLNGSWLLDFEFDEKFSTMIVEKGSISINGVSLTIFNTGINTFRVTIIPYTWNHTNFNQIKAGNLVNLEFDIIGKYINRILQFKS